MDRGNVHRVQGDPQVGGRVPDLQPHLAQHDRRGVEVFDRPQPLLARLERRSPHQVADDQVEDFDRLVRRARLEGGGERYQGGELAVAGQVRDGLGAGGLGEPGQGGDLAGRNPGQVPG